MAQQYTLDGDDAPTEAIVTVVAVMEDCSRLELPPLAEAVDPDALNTLLSDEASGTQISFPYAGHDITATADEVIVEAR